VGFAVVVVAVVGLNVGLTVGDTFLFSVAGQVVGVLHS